MGDGFWLAVLLAIALFCNFGSNKHDLYDLIYDIAAHAAESKP